MSQGEKRVCLSEDFTVVSSETSRPVLDLCNPIEKSLTFMSVPAAVQLIELDG